MTRYLNLIFVILAFSFSIVVLFYKRFIGIHRYKDKSFGKRLFISATFINLPVLFISAVLCGAIHTLYEAFQGSYGSVSRFINDLVLLHPIEALIFAVYIINTQLIFFAIAVFMASFGFLEFLRLKGLLKK
ncbi:MAG: hypothetical protein AAF600_14510 [Bacteroidota bacterium]